MAIIKVHVTTEDRTRDYMQYISKAAERAVVDMGNDLQGVAKQAAPEKTGNLVGHITVNHSMSSGAYQADLESTAIDPETGRDYVDWMHNGKYKLGVKSRAKPRASSKLGNFKKNVGRQYLQGSGSSAKKGYAEYLMKQIDRINSGFD